MHTYILDENNNPVAEPDSLKWAKWYETGNRVVNKTKATVTLDGENVGEVSISTVFLGLDHSFGSGGEPILFETMVFGGKLNEEMDRCSTWEGAEKMHELMCERVKSSVKE